MQMIRYLLVSIIFLSLVSVASARPKIGLVLGGGGAAGVAHVGVLKILEENNIPVDMIAGTSIGAIVGGLYASGMSADELEKTVNSLDWISLFADAQSRADKGFHQKRVGSGFFRNFELGIRDGKLKTPSGLVTGQKLMFELRRLFAPVGHISNFDQLPIPFRAVATDIETGDPVVLGNGNLAQSVRASMAIPGIFSPVHIGNKLLVDGFVSNNVPVSIGRKMGADILIVVNIPTFLEKQSNLDSAVSVSVQAMQLMMLKTTKPELEKMLPNDILIEPGTKDISGLDFARVKETIPLGSKAAISQLKRLKTLAVPGLKFAHQKAVKQAEGVNTDLRIARITIKNNSVLKDSTLARQLGLKEGDKFNSGKLQQGLENIHGLGYFELVDHRIAKNAKGEVLLVINARKKTNGNQRLRFGLSIADDLDGDTRYQFGVKHTLQGINDRGAEWSNSLIIGDTIRFDSALYQPVPEHDVFVDSQFWHEQRDFFFYEGEERLAEVRGRGVGLQFDVGREHDNWGESRAGVFYRYVEPDVKTGERNAAFNRRVLAAGVQLQYNIDTMDKDLLPNEGGRFSVEYTHGFKELGSDQAFDRLWVSGQKAWSKDKHRVLARAEVGTTFADDVLLSEQLSLGGLGRLSGLAEDQLVGNHMVSGSLVYLYELSDTPGFAQFYVGGALETGNVWQRPEDVDVDDLLVGASVFVGADTPLGPAFVGVAQTEGYSLQPFLYLGQSF